MVPTIVGNETDQKYEPMPFPVTVVVKNTGAKTTDTVKVRLMLPPGLEFASPDSPASAEKTTLPATIAAGMEAQVQWLVKHPVTTVEKWYQVQCETHNGQFLQGECIKGFRIPRLLPPLTPTIVPNGPLNFCIGGHVILDAGPGYASYKWNHGPTTRTVTITTGGSFWVTVADSVARSAVSAPVSVTVSTPPTPRLAYNGSLSICNGDTLTLDAGPGYASYSWNTGQTSQRLPVTSGGIWYVTVRTAAGCVVVSDTATTVLYPSLPTPTITRNNDMLLTQVAHRHQWYKDGVLIPGAIDQFLVLSGIGRYTVAAINEYGCESFSAPFDVGALPVDELQRPFAWSLDVFPDPSTGYITIATHATTSDPITITILDAAGRSIMPPCELGSTASQSSTFHISDQPAGVYFVVGNCRGLSQIKKYLKLK